MVAKKYFSELTAHNVLVNVVLIGSVSIRFLTTETEFTGKHRDYPRVTLCPCVSVV